MTVLEDERGFSLLEVVIAIAILATALGALYPIFGTAMYRVDGLRARSFGLVLAQSKLDEQLLLKNWEALPKNGEENGWRWEVRGAKYEHVSDEGRSSDNLYLVEATAHSLRQFDGNEIVLQRIVHIRR